MRLSRDRLTQPKPNQRYLSTSAKEPPSLTKTRRARKIWAKIPLNHQRRESKEHLQLTKTMMGRGYLRDRRNPLISRTMLPKNPNLTSITSTCINKDKNHIQVNQTKILNQRNTVTNSTSSRGRNINNHPFLISFKSIFPLILTNPSQWQFKRGRHSVTI
jgi:hypothetical protein